MCVVRCSLQVIVPAVAHEPHPNSLTQIKWMQTILSLQEAIYVQRTQYAVSWLRKLQELFLPSYEFCQLEDPLLTITKYCNISFVTFHPKLKSIFHWSINYILRIPENPRAARWGLVVPTASLLISTRGVVRETLLIKEANGCTFKLVPITSNRSHFGKSCWNSINSILVFVCYLFHQLEEPGWQVLTEENNVRFHKSFAWFAHWNFVGENFFCIWSAPSHPDPAFDFLLVMYFFAFNTTSWSKGAMSKDQFFIWNICDYFQGIDILGESSQ